MIRDAIFSDIPELLAMLTRSHRRSKYNGRCGVSEKAAEQLLMGAVAGQKQNGPGASFFQVIENDGKIETFMLGVLNRIYGIGDKLCAADVFLISEAGENRSSSIIGVMRLLDNYISWASSNPKVIEIGLSWSDGIANARSFGDICKRKGFHLVGEQFSLATDLGEMAA